MRTRLTHGLGIWVLAAAILTGASFAADSREADHVKLRKLLKECTVALNAHEVEKLQPMFNDVFCFTTVDQKVFTDIDGLKQYFKGLLEGPKAPLKDVQFKPEAASLTRFVDDTHGVCHGTSEDSYTFSDGEVRKMKAWWTATVVKKGEDWKVTSMHLGADILDNPVLNAAKAEAAKAIEQLKKAK